MGELQFVVDGLNAEPFNKSLTLVSLDEQTPLELLQLLNDVFAELSSKNKIDIRDESSEQTGQRMMDFLNYLKYSVGNDPNGFRQQLLLGDKAFVFPILKYILQNFDQLKMRAYLSNYLAPIKVPQDILKSDDALEEAYKQYRALQAEFKDVHRAATKARSAPVAPQEQKKELTQIGEEREQLMSKIANTKKKIVQERSDFEPLLAACTKLRHETDEAPLLVNKLREQRQQLGAVETGITRLTLKLRELQKTEGQGPKALYSALEEEVRMNAYRLHEKLPEELAAMEDHVVALSDILNGHEPSEFEIQALERNVQEMKTECDMLEKQHLESSSNADDNLAMFRQQAQGVSRRKEELMSQLEDVEKDLQEVEKTLGTHQEKLNEVADIKILKGDEFKRYVQELRSKSSKYKSCKASQAVLRSEWGILMRTEEVLKSRADNLETFTKQLEEKYGVGGYSEAQKNLEEVSREKAKHDEVKGQTLEEISMVISQINKTIKEKQTTMAPQVRKLRAYRDQSRQLTTTLNERMTAFESTLAGQRTELDRVEKALVEVQDVYLKEESKYHRLAALSVIASAAKKRIDDDMRAEKSEESLEVLNAHRTHKEAFFALSKEQETLAKKLRARQKEVKEVHEPSMKQLNIFRNLQTLLELKKRVQQKDQEEQEAFEEVMAMGGDAPNQLIL